MALVPQLYPVDKQLSSSLTWLFSASGLTPMPLPLPAVVCPFAGGAILRPPARGEQLQWGEGWARVPWGHLWPDWPPDPTPNQKLNEGTTVPLPPKHQLVCTQPCCLAALSLGDSHLSMLTLQPSSGAWSAPLLSLISGSAHLKLCPLGLPDDLSFISIPSSSLFLGLSL